MSFSELGTWLGPSNVTTIWISALTGALAALAGAVAGGWLAKKAAVEGAKEAAKIELSSKRIDEILISIGELDKCLMILSCLKYAAKENLNKTFCPKLLGEIQPLLINKIKRIVELNDEEKQLVDKIFGLVFPLTKENIELLIVPEKETKFLNKHFLAILNADGNKEINDILDNRCKPNKEMQSDLFTKLITNLMNRVRELEENLPLK